MGPKSKQMVGWALRMTWGLEPYFTVFHSSVPTDRRSFRTGPKKILEVRSAQDLKIAKRTSKDLFFDPGTMIRFFKTDSLEF